MGHEPTRAPVQRGVAPVRARHAGDGPLRTEPHVAYRVDDVHAAIAGLEVLAEPFDVGDGFLTVAFAMVDGAVVEFMQYTNPDEEGWF